MSGRNGSVADPRPILTIPEPIARRIVAVVSEAVERDPTDATALYDALRNAERILRQTARVVET
jgi:hypothetical protein